MDKFDKTMKDYYLDKRLSADALDRILDKGCQAAREKTADDTGVGNLLAYSKPKRFAVGQWQLSGVAVLFLMVVIAAQSYYFQRGDSDLVLAEIAMNHNKHLDVEFPYDSYGALRTAMNRLDFTLSPPSNLPQHFVLVGGRYCSIQGKLAAQLKVKNNATGDISTLYVTALTDKLKKIPAKRVVHDNVAIKLWQDQGHFYGLATDT